MHDADKAQLQHHYPQPQGDQATALVNHRNAIIQHAKALEEHPVVFHPGFHRVHSVSLVYRAFG